MMGSAWRFAVVGVLNTSFGLAIIFLGKWLGLGDYSANLLGYAIGLILSFQLNSRWSFRDHGRRRFGGLRFFVVFGIAWVGNVIALTIMLRGLSINAWIAQCVSVVVYTVLFYIGARFFVFKKSAAALATDTHSLP
jgi:putative flippase GtrA